MDNREFGSRLRENNLHENLEQCDINIIDEGRLFSVHRAIQNEIRDEKRSLDVWVASENDVMRQILDSSIQILHDIDVKTRVVREVSSSLDDHMKVYCSFQATSRIEHDGLATDLDSLLQLRSKFEIYENLLEQCASFWECIHKNDLIIASDIITDLEKTSIPPVWEDFCTKLRDPLVSYFESALCSSCATFLLPSSAQDKMAMAYNLRTDCTDELWPNMSSKVVLKLAVRHNLDVAYSLSRKVKSFLRLIVRSESPLRPEQVSSERSVVIIFTKSSNELENISINRCQNLERCLVFFDLVLPICESVVATDNWRRDFWQITSPTLWNELAYELINDVILPLIPSDKGQFETYARAIRQSCSNLEVLAVRLGICSGDTSQRLTEFADDLESYFNSKLEDEAIENFREYCRTTFSAENNGTAPVSLASTLQTMVGANPSCLKWIMSDVLSQLMNLHSAIEKEKDKSDSDLLLRRAVIGLKEGNDVFKCILNGSVRSISVKERIPVSMQMKCVLSDLINDVFDLAMERIKASIKSRIFSDAFNREPLTQFADVDSPMLKSCLPPQLYLKIAYKISIKISVEFTSQILDRVDISESESTALVERLTFVDNILKLIQVYSSQDTIQPHIFLMEHKRVQDLIFVLGASLREIVSTRAKGKITNMSRQELVGLIKALFSDSSLRAKAISQILEM